MQSSKLGCQTWAIAMYLVVTSLRGISPMKLHGELDVTQKSAWHLAHRIRQAWGTDVSEIFSGPAEVDEAYFGGLETNKHASKILAMEGRYRILARNRIKALVLVPVAAFSPFL